eukprot:1195931-Prorocentrum_minimum.AAC.6
MPAKGASSLPLSPRGARYADGCDTSAATVFTRRRLGRSLPNAPQGDSLVDDDALQIRRIVSSYHR